VLFGWSQVWRTKSRVAESVRRLAVDPHSPPEFRCNGVVRNIDAFYEASLSAIEALPRRQRAVVRHVLEGDSLVDAAVSLGVHPSTASRERTAALARLRASLRGFADDVPMLLATAA
jgi:DNA-directed RNA polymerase specialized sigma24 family protein